jgi:protein-S-isoprenylcysteine O-methyltransferase Ste14
MLVRIVLFAGLVLHKVVWELSKGQLSAAKTVAPARPLGVRLVKSAKVAVLVGLLAQTLGLNLFPISQRSSQVRVIGLLLYSAGLAVALLGRIQLGRNWANIEDHKVLPGQLLVSDGIYAYVRHPIYFGDTMLVIGLQLALNSWLFLCGLPLVAVVLRQARAEETLLTESFPEYEHYRQHTKQLIPYLI